MDLLFKLGVPTYVFTVEVQITANPQVLIGEKLPVNLGWVYGMSTNIIGRTQLTNELLPNDQQIGSLYLSLKYGQAIYVDGLRLSELVFTQPFGGAGTNLPQWQNSHRYFPMNIPLNTDLKLSYISNPLLVSGITVALNLFYIDMVAYKNLLDAGLLYANGISQKKA